MTLAPHVKVAAERRWNSGFVGQVAAELRARGAQGMTPAEGREIWQGEYSVKVVLGRLYATGRATRVDHRYFFIEPNIIETPQVFNSLATLEAMQRHARKIYTGFAEVR